MRFVTSTLTDAHADQARRVAGLVAQHLAPGIDPPLVAAGGPAAVQHLVGPSLPQGARERATDAVEILRVDQAGKGLPGRLAAAR
jgi:hypothetical protein